MKYQEIAKAIINKTIESPELSNIELLKDVSTEFGVSDKTIIKAVDIVLICGYNWHDLVDYKYQLREELLKKYNCKTLKEYRQRKELDILGKNPTSTPVLLKHNQDIFIFSLSFGSENEIKMIKGKYRDISHNISRNRYFPSIAYTSWGQHFNLSVYSSVFIATDTYLFTLTSGTKFLISTSQAGIRRALSRIKD